MMYLISIFPFSPKSDKLQVSPFPPEQGCVAVIIERCCLGGGARLTGDSSMERSKGLLLGAFLKISHLIKV